MSSGIQFSPWSSDVDLAFYASLASLKINHDKLDDSARPLLGLYELRPNDAPERSCRMQLHGNALAGDGAPAGFYRAEGAIRNYNTVEEYRNADRSAIVEKAGRSIWEAIHDGSIHSCPSLLSSFFAISFADLKKYKFTYHVAYPALHSDPPWKLVGGGPRMLSNGETSALVENYNSWKHDLDVRQHGFFLAKKLRSRGPSSRDASREVGQNVPSLNEAQGCRPESPKASASEGLDFIWTIGTISSFEGGFFDDVDTRDRFICFADPSNYPQNPGWMLRNLLILVRQRWHLSEAQILCYRDMPSRRDRARSIVLDLKSDEPVRSDPIISAAKMPRVTGWERNEAGKLNSRVVDLAAYMDPMRLADQSVDLNLKLMKWRIAPSLDLEVIKGTRCLLLGAGTLGSYVSRNLLGWGVRKITFVDNGAVSFSNPVRQPLFNYGDCLEGGAKKAYRAAEALREIYPGVESKGFLLSVPMAGHPIATTDEARVKEEFELLKVLIDEHDAIFLLMDTREARWLPTLMGKAAGKVVMNAALGFDTFVVMRHGLSLDGPEDGGEELGCYFCNDVVAPADSVKDQTLDQQCTVTRPGIAAIASALLVELLVSILQHPLRARAPSPKLNRSQQEPGGSYGSSREEQERAPHPLGLVPHQIRGFLTNFSNLLIRGQSYDCCSACSPKILDRYRQEGWEFVRRALNERGWVEEVSGLADVQRRAEELENEVEWEEDEEGEREGEEEIGGEAELL